MRRPQRSVSATNWIRIAATLSIVQSCHYWFESGFVTDGFTTASNNWSTAGSPSLPTPLQLF